MFTLHMLLLTQTHHSTNKNTKKKEVHEGRTAPLRNKLTDIMTWRRLRAVTCRLQEHHQSLPNKHGKQFTFPEPKRAQLFTVEIKTLTCVCWSHSGSSGFQWRHTPAAPAALIQAVLKMPY